MTAESKKKEKSKTPAKKTTSKNTGEKISSRKLPKEIRWRVFLAPEHPWKTVIILILLAGIILVIGKYVYDIVPGETPARILPSILAGILVFLLFFGSFNPYFISINYHLTREEIVIKKFYHTDRRVWKTFRRFFLTRSGVVLSTFLTRKRFLDNFRGVQLLLPTDTDERKKVLNFIEARLPLDPGQHRE
jgi:hypothetical protein